MARSFTYKGFKDTKGRVLIGVTVEAYDASSGALLETVETDSNGDAAFTALPDAEEADLKFIWGNEVQWIRLGEGIEKVGASPKVGFFDTTKAAQESHIVDADGQLADITTKFNTLLASLETYGLLKTS